MELYYQENGRSVGPVSEEDVARLISENRITAATLVRKPDQNTWAPLGQVCGDASSTPAAGRSRRQNRLLLVIHIALCLVLPFWVAGGWIWTLMAIHQAPLSPVTWWMVLFLVYPVLFVVGVWRSRAASKAGDMRRAYLWTVPAGVVMVPFLLLTIVQVAGYWGVELYGRVVSRQGRFIHAIMSQSSPATLERFIRDGADPNRPGATFEQNIAGTPLEAAMVYNRNPRVVEMLLRNGATPRFDRSLHYAVSVTGAGGDTNTEEIVRLLLGAGASPSTGDVLHQAIANKQPLAVVRLLVEAGADTASRDYFGKTPLIMAAWESDDTAILEYLLSKGSAINAVDHDGDPAIVWAAARKDGLPLISFLLDRGAGITTTNKAGSTVLMTAARRSTDPATVNRLVDRGADVGARDNDGMTPLINAATFNKNPSIVTAILARGADVNARDKDGKTALMRACLQNTYEVCATLVEHGADTQVRDNQGKTAIDYIRMYRKSEVNRYETLFANRKR
jgi:ankyrin repeat protein